MKQTAVEWLEDFMNNGKQKSEGIISLAFSKAKEMEKEQIFDAWENGKEDVFDWLKKMDYDFLVEEIIKSE